MSQDKIAPGPRGWLAGGPGAGGDATQEQVASSGNTFPRAGTYQGRATQRTANGPGIPKTPGLSDKTEHCEDCDAPSTTAPAERAWGMPALCGLHFDVRAGRNLDVAVHAAQARGALIKGNGIRLARAHLKREIRAGNASLATAIRDVPESCATAMIGEMLTWPNRWGPHRRTALLREHVVDRYGLQCDIPRVVGEVSATPLARTSQAARDAIAKLVDDAEARR